MTGKSQDASLMRARSPERALMSGDEWLCGFVGGPTTSVGDQPPKAAFSMEEAPCSRTGFFTLKDEQTKVAFRVRVLVKKGENGRDESLC
jgi:hypothetical protein